MLIDILKKSKVHIFIGMFGSGKTEVAINMALKLKEMYENVAIEDIDTISPYFRTRDEKSYLESKKIKVITPPIKYMYADVPIIPPEVGGYILNPKYKTVLDVGGNDDGSIVLGSLNNFVSQVKASVYFLVNVNRPFTDKKEKIIEHIQRLEVEARLKVNYLISNSNIMEETDIDTVLSGEKILEEVSKELNIPIACTVLEEDVQHFNTNNEKFVIKRFMKKPWEI